MGDVRIEDCLTIDKAVEVIANGPLTFPDDYKINNEVASLSEVTE